MRFPKTTIIPADPKERRVGITQDRYLELFLEAVDFTAPMRMVQDTRLQGPDPRDDWFAKYQGILTGFRVWMASDAVIWRLVDIRTVFPTTWQASAWHAEALLYNSESMSPVDKAPAVGKECRVFGGAAPDLLGVGSKLTHFYYLFRVGRVVVKLYVAQGNDSTIALTPKHVAEIADRIVARIEKAERA
jgi:hypothetical protein